MFTDLFKLYKNRDFYRVEKKQLKVILLSKYLYITLNKIINYTISNILLYIFNILLLLVCFR